MNVFKYPVELKLSSNSGFQPFITISRHLKCPGFWIAGKVAVFRYSFL